MNWDNLVHSDSEKKMTHKQIIDAAIEESVRTALMAVGIDTIKSGPFFGMGDRRNVELKQAA